MTGMLDPAPILLKTLVERTSSKGSGRLARVPKQPAGASPATIRNAVMADLGGDGVHRASPHTSAGRHPDREGIGSSSTA
jgi:transcriptional regulator of heat shock response